nr:hypothetical protein [Candidatus Protofrankia californiensis]
MTLPDAVAVEPELLREHRVVDERSKVLGRRLVLPLDVAEEHELHGESLSMIRSSCAGRR